jgi:hypothetical protein
LHDVVQLAGGKLSNPVRHSRAVDDRRNRDFKRDRERCARNGLHLEPAWMSDELLPAILPNWKIKRACGTRHAMPERRFHLNAAGNAMAK